MHAIETFFDPTTYTLTYLVFDPKTRDAVVIDPVLDYDVLGSRTSTVSADRVIAFAKRQELRVAWVLETHAHADHLSASQYLKNALGCKVAIGERIREVQETFKGVFDLPPSFPVDGGQFDRLLADGETLQVGSLAVQVLSTPGHTPACVSFKIGDDVFTGDALFMDDYGTGRCDFPKGSAAALYHSVHEKLYGLPDHTRVFVGHDYQPNGRALAYETTIGSSKKHNIHLRADTSEKAFVELRTARDKMLAAPRLLFPSVQVNIDAGRLPPAAGNGIRYLRIPVNLGKPTRDDGSSA
jgi:glyoxylase-like metal-dependent hydrolase (beta-lactamase superfamily II)